MNRFNFCFTFALLLSSMTTSAVTLSVNDRGELLIYPLVHVGATAQGAEYNTIFRIRNTSADHVLARAVLRSGDSGDSALEWDVFLKPHEIWSAAVYRDQDDVRVTPKDFHCFRDAVSGQLGGDVGSTLDVESSVDHFWLEVVELGSLVDSSGIPIFGGCTESVFSAALAPQANRLTGEAYLIDRSKSASFPIMPTTLADTGLMIDNVPLPVPSDLFRSVAPSAMIDGIETTWETGVDAISAVLATSQLTTTFTARSDLSGANDFIALTPTRNYANSASEELFLPNSQADHAESGVELHLQVRNEHGHRVGLEIDKSSKCTPAPPPPTQIGPVLSDPQSGFFVGRFDDPPLIPLRDSEMAGIYADVLNCGALYNPFDAEFGQPEGSITIDLSEIVMTSLEGIEISGLPIVLLNFAVLPVRNADGSHENYMVLPQQVVREIELR